MSLRALITFILGIVGLVLLVVYKADNSLTTISLLSMTSSQFGWFYGLWNLLALLFKSITLTSKEKVFLILGTIISFIAYALSNYGLLLIFLVPAALISFTLLRIVFNIFKKTGGTVTNNLQTKINQMEAQIQKPQE